MPEFNPALIPTRSRLPSVLAAAGILIAIAAAVLYFSPHKTAELTITRVQIYAAHTETRAMQGSTHIIGTSPHADDDLYVLLTVKLTDKLRLPLFIKDETAILTAPDHSVADSSAIEVPDLPNLYTTFPALQKLASEPLARDTRVAPRQPAEGMVLLHFPGATQENWTNRQSATLTLDLYHQSSQTVTIP
ncbi:MAG TPA: hypothetical protein VIJ79_02095 [Acidobacteriaceae bacterium]